VTQPNALSEEELTEINDRAAAATPGPWTAHVEGRDFLGGSSCIVTGSEDLELSGASEADYDFIAHARQDIPRLVTEIRSLRAKLDQHGPASAS
jgi:hypothetical protein